MLRRLEFIKKINPEINAIVQYNEADALEQARLLDKKQASGEELGPLHGVIFTVKDVFKAKGYRTTAGSLGLKDAPLDAEDATIIQRVKKAGAILIGKTNTPEFENSADTINSVFGATKNPYNLDRSAGGSSGGCGAAVASCMSDFSIGADHGGSLRIPAHYNGVTTIRCTPGRIPSTGYFSGVREGIGASVNTEGPIARYVDDLVLIVNIIQGPDGIDKSVIKKPPLQVKDQTEELSIAFFYDDGNSTVTQDVRNAVHIAALAITSDNLVEKAKPNQIGKGFEIYKKVFWPLAEQNFNEAFKKYHVAEPSPLITKLMESLGADIKDEYALEYARKRQSAEIDKIFNLSVNNNQFFVENVESNDLATVSRNNLQLGLQLVEAFHNKQKPDKIHELVSQGAPVNFRLDYGLPVKLESNFVAQFFLLLEGDKGEVSLRDNAILITGDRANGVSLSDYVKTGLEIFEILHSKIANTEEIKVNPEFYKLVENNAIRCRANPEHKNGSLIISAGLRNPQFTATILSLGKSSQNNLENGASVNFKGYFGDNAAVWSTILLDKETLKLLLDNGSEINNVGVTNSSLLHWVAVAERLEKTIEGKTKAIEIAQMLIEHGAEPFAQNKLGKTPIDYARGELKTFLSNTNIKYNVTR